jgi:hypothetical protein
MSLVCTSRLNDTSQARIRWENLSLVDFKAAELTGNSLAHPSLLAWVPRQIQKRRTKALGLGKFERPGITLARAIVALHDLMDPAIYKRESNPFHRAECFF